MKGNTKLKDFRNRTGLEQKEMAKEIHVSPSFIRPVGSDKGLLVDCDQDPRLMSDANYKGMYKLSVKSTTAPDVCKRL